MVAYPSGFREGGGEGAGVDAKVHIIVMTLMDYDNKVCNVSFVINLQTRYILPITTAMLLESELSIISS